MSLTTNFPASDLGGQSFESDNIRFQIQFDERNFLLRRLTDDLLKQYNQKVHRQIHIHLQGNQIKNIEGLSTLPLWSLNTLSLDDNNLVKIRSI